MVATFQYSLLDNNIEALKSKKEGIINFALISKNIIYAEEIVNNIAQKENITSAEDFNNYLKTGFDKVNLEDFNLDRDKYSFLLYLEHKDKKMDRKYYKVLYLDNRFYLKEMFS